MLMKKKLLFGAIAAAFVALNALAFSSFAAAPGGSGGGVAPGNLPYQSMGYCDAWHLRLKCQKAYTAERCKVHCGKRMEAVVEFAIDDKTPGIDNPNFGF